MVTSNRSFRRGISLQWRVVAALSAAVLTMMIPIEYTARVLWRQRLGEFGAVFAFDPRFGHFHAPRTRLARYHFREKAGSAESWHEIAINAHGLRDKERTLKKPPGVQRILVLGDSMVFAEQVPDRQRFTEVLEARLRAAHNNVEVINAGVDGYGTAQEYLFYTHLGRKYRPDLVILTFFVGNDIMDNNRLLSRRLYYVFVDKPYFELRDGRLALRNYPVKEDPLYRFKTYRMFASVMGKHSPGLIRWANRYGFLANWPLFGEFVSEGLPMHIRIFFRQYDETWSEAWAVTKELIAAMRDRVAADGGDFLVLLLPDRLQTNHRPSWNWLIRAFPSLHVEDLQLSRPHDEVLPWLTDKGIDYVDMLPTFADYQARTGKSPYFEVDIHLNARGHQLVADAILDHMVKREGRLELRR